MERRESRANCLQAQTRDRRGVLDHRIASCDGDRRSSAGRSGFLRGCARPAAREEDRQLRQSPRVPLLLRYGAPGTIWTTFPYHGHGVRVGAKGAGQITATSLSVPSGTLDFWKARLKARGTAVADAEPRFGEASVIATDPSGLVMELVATDRGSRPGMGRWGCRSRRGRARRVQLVSDPVGPCVQPESPAVVHEHRKLGHRIPE
jgi:catechol 2,3-dioxygenase-like lactoylglutathione lyase family enzyme